MSSSEVYALSFKDGEPAPFPRSTVERIFNRGAINSDLSTEVLYWADGEAEIDCGLGEEIDGLCCIRFVGLTCIERLYELAAEVGLVIIWPGGEPECFVTDETIIAHLPADFSGMDLEVVHSARELFVLMEFQWVNPEPHHRIA